METKVILCDVCKKMVAKNKCELCGDDICEENDCNHNREINVYNAKLINIMLCKKCDENLYSKIRNSSLQKEQLKPFLLDLFRKNIMVDTLMKGGNNK